MTPQEQWQSYYDYAEAEKAAVTPVLSYNGVIGRSITFLVNRLVKFWGDHKSTLIPVLSQLAIAALEALVAQQANIDLVDPPGPQ